jgi:hypothetical protein
VGALAPYHKPARRRTALDQRLRNWVNSGEAQNAIRAAVDAVEDSILFLNQAREAKREKLRQPITL